MLPVKSLFVSVVTFYFVSLLGRISVLCVSNATSCPTCAPRAPGLSLLSRGCRPRSARFLVQVARQPPLACCRSSWSQSGSSEHTGVPEFCEMLGSARPRLTVSVCCLKGAGPRSARSPVQVATASRRLDPVAPSPFCLSSDICARFHGSPLRTSIISAGDVHL